jgi:pyridoxal phosphate enzyme (YggS family)
MDSAQTREVAGTTEPSSNTEASSSSSASGAAAEPTAEECQQVVQRLLHIKNEISALASKLGLTRQPRLVAVSKTKPAAFVRACYEAGHTHFGENYVQELIQKSKQVPPGVRWHFIGHLQSNKCKAVAGVGEVECVETIDSLKLAKALDKAVAATATASGRGDRPLHIMIQVNTSAEDTKSGVEAGEVVELVRKVRTECSHLRVVGLMTIGRPGPNPEIDFRALAACRAELCKALDLSIEEMELSMGMSHDYLKAIEEGSTNVRVGSSIFGERVYHT